VICASPSLYWGLTSRQRYTLFALFAIVVGVLYLYNLDGTGVLDPDEPRYAAIGQSMAHTGDWVTPRLWGSPWFEKPALLYWMTAVGTAWGLNPDLAGRLPVALLALLFLFVWFLLMRQEFGDRIAAAGTLLLSTSALWLVYGGLCLTDIPLSVFFSMEVALALPLLRGEDDRKYWWGIGLCLGLATLAKGLVPIMLSIPLMWFLRLQWRRWWMPVIGSVAVAAPWYILVIYRNGYPFIEDFFLKQHFERLYSHTLQHVRPVYFYIAVLLAALFPWTPLLFALRPKAWLNDRRLRFLALTAVFGFLFFSVSLNKLSGYLLPLMPAVSMLIAAAIGGAEKRYEQRRWLISCAILISLIPLVGQVVPVMLTARLTSVRQILLALLPITPGMLVLFVTPLIVAGMARRSVAGILLILCCAIAGLYLRSTIYPVLDRQASPRALWKQIAPEQSQICDAGLHRAWKYGLEYYKGSLIPSCDATHLPVHLMQKGSQPAYAVRQPQ
jgi:4-amino-4-deoxy-L-arabinose transferase-like glycosyltransferase